MVRKVYVVALEHLASAVRAIPSSDHLPRQAANETGMVYSFQDVCIILQSKRVFRANDLRLN